MSSIATVSMWCFQMTQWQRSPAVSCLSLLLTDVLMLNLEKLLDSNPPVLHV